MDQCPLDISQLMFSEGILFPTSNAEESTASKDQSCPIDRSVEIIQEIAAL